MTIVGDLAIGVASSLIFEAMKRPFQAISAEMNRRNQIGRALSDRQGAKTLQNEKFDVALLDVARVIGNSQGLLTQEVAEFLRELQRTVFPDAIANAAFSGADPSTLREPFEKFYSRFENLPFTANTEVSAMP